jgi:hypothetical protein
MRRLVSSLLVAVAACAFAPSARAQHAPRIAARPEVGAELRFSDELVEFAGILQAPLGRRTDGRAGLGIASPDKGDSEAFLIGGLRTLVSRRSARFPLDVALDGELNLFLGDETSFLIEGGPTLGAPAGRAGLLVPYVEPLLVIVGDGDTDTDLAVRLGADYALTPTIDLRGDLRLDGDATLRAALYFEL